MKLKKEERRARPKKQRPKQKEVQSVNKTNGPSQEKTKQSHNKNVSYNCILYV